MIASRLAAQEDAEEAALMAELEDDLENYVADMRARWRKSVTPKRRNAPTMQTATNEIAAA